MKIKSWLERASVKVTVLRRMICVICRSRVEKPEAQTSPMTREMLENVYHDHFLSLAGWLPSRLAGAEHLDVTQQQSVTD